MRLALLLLWMPLAARAADDYQHRVEQVLLRTPLIDGHNDLPWEIRDRFKSDLSAVDLKSDTKRLPFPADAAPLMTDIPRMRAGHMGGQFWSVWIPSAHAGARSGSNDARANGSGQAHGRPLSRRFGNGYTAPQMCAAFIKRTRSPR